MTRQRATPATQYFSPQFFSSHNFHIFCQPIPIFLYYLFSSAVLTYDKRITPFRRSTNVDIMGGFFTMYYPHLVYPHVLQEIQPSCLIISLLHSGQSSPCTLVPSLIFFFKALAILLEKLCISPPDFSN